MLFKKELFPQDKAERHAGRRGIYAMLLCLFFMLAGNSAKAQTADTADKIKIIIANSGSFEYFTTDSGVYIKFVKDVILYQGTDTLYCDSLYQNNTTKNLEAYGAVRIAQQGGTQGTCSFLRYESNKKLAFMQGDVHLTDGKNDLACEELTYDLATKIGVYDKGGILHNDSTTVKSRKGIYNGKTKDAQFTERVTIDDPQYKIKSEDLVYNTETKVTTFYAISTVVRDSGRSILKTASGTYDGVNGVAHFTGHSSIWNDDQYIEADTLNYSKLTGFGLAIGNVISIDTEHHSTMYCGRAEYFQKQRIMWATVKPVLVQVNGKDTLYMRADTFYSAPMVQDKSKDSLKKIAAVKNDTLAMKGVITPIADTAKAPAYKIPIATKATEDKATKKKKSKKGVAVVKPVATDTAQADTTAPLYFIGYHHVLIFSDSLQGKCDSVSYTRSDSMIRMMINPIAWSRKSQITGDTILMQLDSNNIRTMHVPNNAFVVSQSGPDKALMYDQVQGKMLTAHFKNNDIDSMLVCPNAETIYYQKDDEGAYLGVSQAKGDSMVVLFNNQNIKQIKYWPDFHTTMTPLEKANIPATRLSRFTWMIDQRPKTKEELFD